MKKWLVYLLGVITGIILTLVLAVMLGLSKNGGIMGLDMFEEPGDYMEYSQFEVFQVVNAGCALAHVDDSYSTTVFIIPNENQKFYDDQKIVLGRDQRAQHVGTYQYRTRMGIERTVPAVIIVDGVDTHESDRNYDGKTLFDKPGECVSRKNFEVQKVLASGDAIALEIRESYGGYILTSDLEVLILAQENGSFYDNQIIKTPKGKCARQIGTYKYEKYGMQKVIPIIAFK